MSETIEFTLGDFINAIEKNGLPQAFGHMFRTYENSFSYRSSKGVDNQKITYACAIGQAAINLGIETYGIETSLGDANILETFMNTIVELNDEERKPLPEIAAILRKVFEHSLNVSVDGIPREYTVAK